MIEIQTVIAPNPSAFTLDGTRTYVIDRSIVIDPGPSIASHVEAIRSIASDLRAVLITHRHGDHAPAAADLAGPGVRIFAPRSVLDDRVVTDRLSGGERVVIGSVTFEAIATPGHTAEHVCFLTDDGDLFTGDMILGAGTTAVFPPDGRMGDYVASLKLLRERAPRRIWPGHGPMRTDAVELIDGYIAHRLEREEQIIRNLADPSTIDQLREAIYPDIPVDLHGGAAAQLAAHLEHLREKGQVFESEGKWSRAAGPSV